AGVSPASWVSGQHLATLPNPWPTALAQAFPTDGPLSAYGTTGSRLRRGGRAVAEHELRDLDRVQRRALAQVVAREEQREAVVDRGIAADPSDQHLVLAGGLAR